MSLIRILLCAAIWTLAGSAHAQSPPSQPVPLRLIAFDGGWNLPVWAAQRQGYFEAQGVAVQLSYTPNSAFLVASLLDGKADIALATIDNLVAYQEGQGEAKIPDNPTSSRSWAATVVSFRSWHDRASTMSPRLKGKTLSVDAMTTGLAFVLRELVVPGGLAESDVTFVRAGGTASRYRDLIAGKHDATLLRTPFELLASGVASR
jgi:ABC-type nitrate/sulfonate/bicarbonate transport system substrate-binding protein